ncbi:MAG TPA: PQQ-binding-like beta-propeller repeat protein [Acidimicrobiales bacterium]|nr:PQQ-binding-like beta-propeller repeat protein [Acidimicrobiales bacterium]
MTPATRSRLLRPALGLCVAVLGSALLVSPARAGAAAGPWPEALHDPAHSAGAPVVGPSTGTVEWTRQLDGNITPGPSIGTNGAVYVATNSGVLYALDLSTGDDLWTFEGGGPFRGETDLSVSPLVLPSGSVLWPGPNDTLYEISPTGHALWSHRFGAMVLSPVLAGTRVYVELMSGTLWQLQIGSGVPVLGWSLRIGHTSFGSPAVGTDGEVVTTADKSVVGVVDDGSRGVIAWRRQTGADIEVSPAVGPDGDVYVSANDGSVYRLSPHGALRWKRHIGQESYSSSSVSEAGMLYFGDNGGDLNVVRAATGALVRVDHGRQGIWGAQAIDARGDVYFGTQGREIYGYGPSGRRLFTVTASGPIDSYPALSGNGTLVIGDEAGTLYAIG